MITSLHWYTWSNMPNICGTRRRKEKHYVNKTNFRCFRDGLSWIPDALKSIVLNPPGWAVHQRTAASHLRLFFNTYKNDRWIWSTCFSCCVTRAFFFSFFLLRCTDCETDWTAGDEASVRAWAGSEVFGDGWDLQQAAGRLRGHGAAYKKPPAELWLFPWWHPCFCSVFGED